jgi:hypothetical protein
MLMAIQWPTRAYPIDPHHDGAFFLEACKENLVNTSIVTYLQYPPSNCMSCHQVFNARATSSACSVVFAEALIAAAHCAGRTSFASRMTFPVRSKPGLV